ncbi:DUF3846 domain-containing protein [Psychrobacillus sp. FSL H8-0487]|uniref:DUF3846 domain-containing protein n=1 Tax=Psychrobacillus sp. FSL H8-0487 TaxID=2921391 RepID=UPI0030FBBCC1
MKKLKVLYKAPNLAAEVKEIEGSVAGMQKAVDGSCFACTEITDQIDLWYNDEFLFHDFQPNLFLDSVMYHGSVFFAGHDEMGNTISLNEQQIDYLKKRIVNVGENLAQIFFNLSESDVDLAMFKMIIKDLGAVGTGDVNE